MSLDQMKSTPEIASLLSQLSTLQGDKEKMMKQIEQLSSQLSHMKEGKREEMRKIFDNVIQKWLTASVNDENVRKHFTDGMERIIENTHENGVWTVAVEASNLHARQIEELEKLRSECESLKAGSAAAGGTFKDENCRKRGREEVKSGDFWAGFQIDQQDL